MLPLLYTPDATQAAFARNGLGFLHGLEKCFVWERLNGIYELEAAGQRDPGRTVTPNMFLKCPPNPGDDAQIFEVRRAQSTDELVTIEAQHLRYIAFNNIITEAVSDSTPRTPAQWWTYVSDLFACENYTTFTSDITDTGVITAGRDRPLRLGDFLVGTKGSMVDVFGGHLKYNNFGMSLLSRRGKRTGIAVRYGGNVSSHTQEIDGTTVYTHLYPFAYVRAEENSTGRGLGERAVFDEPVSLSNARLTYERALSYDFSDDFRDDTMIISQGSGAPVNFAELRDKLRALTASYVSKNGAALRNVSVSITIDTGDALRSLQKVELGDTVLVELGDLDGPVRVQVQGIKYDVLEEKIAAVELGRVRKTLADLIGVKNIGGA